MCCLMPEVELEMSAHLSSKELACDFKGAFIVYLIELPHKLIHEWRSAICAEFSDCLLT